MDLMGLLNSHHELTLTPALLVIFYLLYRIDKRLYRLEILNGANQGKEAQNADVPV